MSNIMKFGSSKFDYVEFKYRSEYRDIFGGYFGYIHVFKKLSICGKFVNIKSGSGRKF